VVRLVPEYDADTYRRLDNVVERDVRSVRYVASWESVMVPANAAAQGTTASDLFDLIRNANAQGNAVKLRPDKDAPAPNATTPQMDVLTRGAPPEPYELEQSTQRLRRSFEVQSAQWYDPAVPADKETIDDLNSLDTAL